jgi:hypothetical protein
MARTWITARIGQPVTGVDDATHRDQVAIAQIRNILVLISISFVQCALGSEAVGWYVPDRF